MKKYLLGTIIFATSLSWGGGVPLAATLFQQVGIASSPNPVGSGARAIGMGGAFIAVCDDATAASWNPGGLIQVEKSEISLVGGYFSRKERYSSLLRPEIDNQGENHEMSINYFSMTYPKRIFRRNMVFSLNYQRLYDFKRTLEFKRDFTPSGVEFIQHTKYSQKGFLGAAGLGYAIQVTPQLSLGTTINFWTPKLFWKNGWSEELKSDGAGVQGGTAKFTETRIKDIYSNFSGLNANFGFFWSIDSFLTIGAVYKLPFKATVDHDFNLSSREALGSPVNSSPLTNFDFSEQITLTMPRSYGVGFGLRFSDSFTIALDVFRTEWSEYILVDSKGNHFSPVDGRRKEKSNVSDTTHIRIGGEYIIKKHQTIFPLRGGLFYDPEPSEKVKRDFWGGSLGIGFARKRFSADFAYQFRWGENVDSGNLIGTSKADVYQHKILVSLIVYR